MAQASQPPPWSGLSMTLLVVVPRALGQLPVVVSPWAVEGL